MKIHNDVYYRLIDHQVYLRHVVQRKDYLFNEIVFDILEIISDNPGCTVEFLCGQLITQYHVTDARAFREDISSFVDGLIQNQIVLDDAQEKEDCFENRIGRSVQETCSENRILLNATLELTYRCNERCIHCYIDDPPDVKTELEAEDYFGILDQLEELGCMSILLTGGEPTLHPDFLEIAKYVKSKKMLLNIYTNGYSISDSLLDQILALRPNSISFSFYGGDAKTHDAVTQVAGSFERSLKTMLICKCAGIDTYIKSVAMKQNFDAFEDLIKLARRLNIDITTSLVIAPTHGGKSADPYRLLDPDKYGKIIRMQVQYGLLPDKVSGHRADHFCNAGRNMLSFDPYGNIHPCNGIDFKIGNVKESRIADVWSKSSVLNEFLSLRFNQMNPECGKCKKRDFCSVCIGCVCKENGGKLDRGSDTCMITEAKQSIYSLEGRCANEKVYSPEIDRQ